jgi:hypothetical protein
MAKTFAIPNRDYATLLALATLGDVTQIGWFLFVSWSPSSHAKKGWGNCCSESQMFFVKKLCQCK